MDALFVILISLFMVLAGVTVIGHAIWVFLSFLFGRRDTRPPRESAADLYGIRRSCPRCFTPFGANAAECQVCGWPRTIGHATDNQSALAALREQLVRLAGAGAVDGDARDELLAVLAVHEERIAAKRAAAANVATKEKTGPKPISLGDSLASTGSAATSSPPKAIDEDTPAKPAEPAKSFLSAPERVRKYAASRTAATESRTDTVEPRVPLEPAMPQPRKQREALARLFASFMEEKNIRWGELVGGLLIVGCSIALVISFWSEIAERPLLKFGLLGGVTAALFGVGLYTDRRWKIHTTSHGVLVIASLLVPLNFLAIAAFTQEAAPNDVLSLVGEGASLVVFALLLFLAGRILVPGAPLLLTVGVMIPSLMQLIVRRFAMPNSSLALQYALAVVPVLAYVVASIVYVARHRAGGTAAGGESSAECSPETLSPQSSNLDLRESAAHRALIFLSIVSAAVVIPLALLTFKVPPAQETLHWLAPLGVPLGLPALLVGLLFWTRLRDANLTGLQTAGVAVGALGALVMVGALALAWPDPATLLPTAIVAALVFGAVAYGFEIPAAHLAAGLALAAAWLVGFHYLRGNIGWTLSGYEPMSRALLSAPSGQMLLPLTGLFAGLAFWLGCDRRDDSRMYSILTALSGAASVALVMWFGFARAGDPENVTWILGLYAIATLAAAAKIDRPVVAWTGMALLLAALAQGIVYRYGAVWQLERPWIVALLAHASMAVAGAGAISWLRVSAAASLPRVLRWSAIGLSTAAMALIAVTVATTSAAMLATNMGWVAAIWLALAIASASAEMFAASQIAAALAIFSAVVVAVESRPWYANSVRPWLDPWFLQSQGLAIGGFCLAFDLLRKLLDRFIGIGANNDPSSKRPALPSVALGNRLLNPPWPAVDEILEGALVALVTLMALYAAMPGAAQELAPIETARGAAAAIRVVPSLEQFEIAGIPHEHAADYGTWLVAAVILAALSLGIERFHLTNPRWGALALGLVIVCALVAQRWEGEVAVASALRWLSAGAFAAMSVLIWLRRQNCVAKRIEAGSGVGGSGHGVKAKSKSAVREFRNLLVALIVLLYTAMGTYVAWQAVRVAGAPRGPEEWLTYLLAWTLAAALAALALPRTVDAAVQVCSFDGALLGVRSWIKPAASVLMVLAFAPLAVLLTFALATALDQHPIVGPEFGSWFRRIGWDASYGVPLVVIAMTLIAYAIRDRSSHFAFSAGLLFNVVATIVVLLRLARGGVGLDAEAWMNVAQANAIVAGVVALCWLAVMEWHRSGRPLAEQVAKPSPPALLVTQVALAATLCATFIAPATVRVVITWSSATTLPPWVNASGGALGWGATVLAVIATAWFNRGRAITQRGVSVVVGAAVAMGALTVAHQGWGTRAAYNTLLIGCCAAAWLLPLATRVVHRIITGANAIVAVYAWSDPAVRWFAVIAVGLAIYEYTAIATWWTPAALAAISARNVWISWREARREFMWIAAALSVIAVSIWWAEWGHMLTGTSGAGEVFEFLWVGVLALAVMAIVSVSIERRRISVRSDTRVGGCSAGLHRFAAWLIVAVLGLTTGIGLLADSFEDSVSASAPLAWAAWLAALIAAIACWWDSASRWPVACVYCVGLLAVGLYLDGLDFQAPLFHWALANSLAAYSLTTSYLWSRRAGIRTALTRWDIPTTPPAEGNIAETTTSEGPRNSATWEGSGHGWLVPANFLLGLGVLVLVVWIELYMDNFTHRMVAAYAIGAQALALGLLARGTVRTSLQYTALVFGVLFAIAFGWAWVPPDHAAPWLHRVIVSLVAVAVTTVLYGFGLAKFLQRENEWTRAAARLVPLLAVAAASLLVAVLGAEVALFIDRREVPITWAAVIAVAVALIGLAIAALTAALLPGRDPLGLSQRGRTAYVYVAEALAGLLFLHIRVTMPWLFSGWFLRFWPLVVMVIAFLGVGLGELFQRRRPRVLSEPLQTTGALLPLLPALGFWVVTSEIHYSLLLLSIGALYGALAVLRRSFFFGILAAISANGSLWYLLFKQEGLGLLEHPQLWLIPPAFSALAAGYINRERLTREQSAALRYFSAIVIYVSSTADIFINGVADALWLPAMLAGLSIAGVFAGILLRVRAFLYLGISFLLVAILTIIWYAAVEQQRTYILWVAGIVTGVLILAVFAVFEKRRDDVLRVVEELKQWQA